MKKLLAILMVFSMLFAFASCKDNTEDPAKTPEIVTDQNGETVTDEYGETVTKAAGDENTDASSEEISSSQSSTEESTAALTDPSTWTKEEIVAFYKNAAAKSKNVKSTQTMTMSEMVVNDGDGLLGTMLEWATPILKSILAENSTEFDGITGGYKNLVASDVASAKAYKSGEYTVVEMTMVEQTDGVHGDTYSGTVGHAISVVGDVSVNVGNALADYFVIDFENSDLTLKYSNPTLKVKINKNGIIEKGTWSYTVDVDLKNLKIAGANVPLEVNVKSGYGSVDYNITVGGGF